MDIADHRAGVRAVARIRLAPNPVTTFAAASLLFGSLIILATPPLRGPDETAHFLRAYGAAAGDIIPSLRDEYGRKGVLLPPRLQAGFDYFDSLFKQKGFDTRTARMGRVARVGFRDIAYWQFATTRLKMVEWPAAVRRRWQK